MTLNRYSKAYRGIVKNAAAEQGKLLRLDLEGAGGAVLQNKRSFGNYGFQSRPTEDSEVVYLRTGNSIYVIASDNIAIRMELKDGDVVMNSDLKNFIKVKGKGGIEVDSDTEVIVNCNKIKLGSESAVKKLCTEEILSTIAGHLHPIVNGAVGVSLDPGMIALPLDPKNKTQKVEGE